ncbi:hypothetical protein Ancab_008591 [Ancistrocladus abbreviatus]
MKNVEFKKHAVMKALINECKKQVDFKGICVNLYECNMDKNQWKNPEVWNPKRFLVDEYEPHDLYKTMAIKEAKGCV